MGWQAKHACGGKVVTGRGHSGMLIPRYDCLDITQEAGHLHVLMNTPSPIAAIYSRHVTTTSRVIAHVGAWVPGAARGATERE